jgi:site-specific DNA recombinase
MKSLAPIVKRRCGIYCRKSTEEGLEQEFNSLDAQRDACEAYVASQRAEGLVLAPDRYDDGGYSGATLARPALQRLQADIKDGKIDVVVVYKIDRLTRALMDFAKLVEVFDEHQVTFVSVTQSFNTTTSMGRLTLNMLLSFAQFEREVIGERIRDKVAASRRKGMWMGGWAPLGYDVKDRKLVANEPEATVVRSIFARFARGTPLQELLRQLHDEGARNKQGKPIDKGYFYRILNNRVYLGEAVHKGTSYPGEHVAIIDRKVWDQAHALIDRTPRNRVKRPLGRTPAVLKGLIFGPGGTAMTPAHTRKSGKLYRYYISSDLLRGRNLKSAIRRIPAAQIEAAVISQIKTIATAPEVIVATWRAARQSIKGLSEQQVFEELKRFDAIWSELFPAEQARIIQLLVDRVEISETSAKITLRLEGLASLLQDMRGNGNTKDAPGAEPRRVFSPINSRLTTTVAVQVPMRFQICGGRKTILSQEPDRSGDDVKALHEFDHAPHQVRTYNALIKALARAHRWRRMLEQGEYSSMTELAKDKGVNESYACRILRLTLLAPSIATQILDGRYMSNLMLKWLMKPFPSLWDEQISALT